MTAWLTVVGIGDDGYAGLGRPARRALADAAVVMGGERHLAMLPARHGAERVPWPKPFDLAPLFARAPARVCVLASGDPMLFGVGATLASTLAPNEWRVLPAPSSLSLAAARIGWPLQDVDAVSLVGRPLASLHRHLYPGRRLFVLSADGATPTAIAGALAARGFGPSAMTVFEHLGGPLERRADARADAWGDARAAALNVVAIECRASADAPRLALTPGLPDDAYRHDGQLTKRDLRALALGRLAPAPGELLWDVGAGSGSIGIEWMRAHPSCRTIAIEAHPA
ncbi:precorrin-6y C5,15-methyltransferase (decarboxylating) subunit CbiE, partial [Burkholderia thailandensis]